MKRKISNWLFNDVLEQRVVQPNLMIVVFFSSLSFLKDLTSPYSILSCKNLLLNFVGFYNSVYNVFSGSEKRRLKRTYKIKEEGGLPVCSCYYTAL